jgi:hypothetical protein
LRAPAHGKDAKSGKEYSPRPLRQEGPIKIDSERQDLAPEHSDARSH